MMATLPILYLATLYFASSTALPLFLNTTSPTTPTQIPTPTSIQQPHCETATPTPDSSTMSNIIFGIFATLLAFAALVVAIIGVVQIKQRRACKNAAAAASAAANRDFAFEMDGRGGSQGDAVVLQTTGTQSRPQEHEHEEQHQHQQQQDCVCPKEPRTSMSSSSTLVAGSQDSEVKKSKAARPIRPVLMRLKSSTMNSRTLGCGSGSVSVSVF